MVTPRYLLDANVLSEPLRPRPDLMVTGRLDRHKSESATGAPVLHEMIYGYDRLPPSRRRSATEHWVTSFVRGTLTVLPYDVVAADWHARERARLAGLGLTPPYIDGQIAAIAATNGLILVTANLADFQHFRGLQVEDWRE